MRSTSTEVYPFIKQDFLVSCPRNNEYILVRRVKGNHYPSNLEVRPSPAEPCPKRKANNTLQKRKKETRPEYNKEKATTKPPKQHTSE